MNFSRDRIIGFIWGFLTGVVAMWLTSYLPFPLWGNVLILLVLGLVAVPLVQSRMKKKRIKEEV